MIIYVTLEKGPGFELSIRRVSTALLWKKPHPLLKTGWIYIDKWREDHLQGGRHPAFYWLRYAWGLTWKGRRKT